jgi:hypothetical protein
MSTVTASVPLRRLAFLTLLAVVAGCAAPAPPDAAAIRALPPDATLDARGLGRGAAARPAAVQVLDNPASPAVFYTVSPRLQTGSVASPPMIVTSLGAERPRQGGTVAYRALVVVSNARRFGDFTRAATRQGEAVAVQVAARERPCDGAGGCRFVETLILTFDTRMLRDAAAAGTPLRLRISGSASFIEVNLPTGHLRALADATVGA